MIAFHIYIIGLSTYSDGCLFVGGCIELQESSASFASGADESGVRTSIETSRFPLLIESANIDYDNIVSVKHNLFDNSIIVLILVHVYYMSKQSGGVML